MAWWSTGMLYCLQALAVVAVMHQAVAVGLSLGQDGCMVATVLHEMSVSRHAVLFAQAPLQWAADIQAAAVYTSITHRYTSCCCLHKHYTQIYKRLLFAQALHTDIQAAAVCTSITHRYTSGCCLHKHYTQIYKLLLFAQALPTDIQAAAVCTSITHAALSLLACPCTCVQPMQLPRLKTLVYNVFSKWLD
jgi:hypothetical protein